MKRRQPAAGSALGGAPAGLDVSDAELLERFVRWRDESAFAALMVRHGPMVFGVCRRVLRHTQDAEDAFQATFLILVRKAADIGQRELLGNWLYGVARRVSARARLLLAKRRTREAAERERVAVATREPVQSLGLPEVIEDEVRRLPAKYRGPVVFCYLEGRTNEEAAGELRCPVGTVKTRLARAREMLRKRLTRRGVILSTAAIVTALSAEALAASLPPVLIDSTLKAAMSFAVGDAAAAGLVSAQTAALTKGVLHTMFVTKMKTLAALVLALAVIGGGTGMFTYHLSAKEGDAKKTDKEIIQGTWKVESVMLNGKEQADAKTLEMFTWTIAADKMLVTFGGEKREHAYTIDPSIKPKTIDITEKDKTTPALYELDGDTLKICESSVNPRIRPTEVASKEGSSTLLFVLKRAKK